MDDLPRSWIRACSRRAQGWSQVEQYLRARWSKRYAPEDGCDSEGFSIIEVIVAITILALVLFAAEWGAIGSMSASALSKQHSVATSLISATIASVEALPFSEVQAGLDPTVDSLSGDANVTKSGQTYQLKLAGNATILTNDTCSSDCTENPLVPHISSPSIMVGGLAYTIATYPLATSSSSLVNLVVVVTWQPPTGGTATAVGEASITQP